MEFNQIGLLITHYNRSKSLKRQLRAFQDLNIKFGQIVISDDCSPKEHQLELKKIASEFNAELVLAETNKGLGNNINKGQERIQVPYTLYVQEDFCPKEKFKDILPKAMFYMENEPDLDMVRLYAYSRYPHQDNLGDGFGRMKFSFGILGNRKFYMYSDHPHLRRTSFTRKFGKYKEGHNPEQTEYRMMMAFVQRKGTGLFYNDHKSLFHHGNTEDEPSTMMRNSLRRSKNPIITVIRNTYRTIKFNLNYLFGSY